LNKRVKQSAKQTLQTIVNLLPIIIGMLLLTSLAVTILPRAISAGLFGDHAFFDVLLGALIGSVAVGQPLASYILGGELLDGGVNLLAVTALIVSWVTVGLLQLPAEALLLGSRFAIVRNLTCIVFAIGVSYFTVYTLRLIG